MFETFLLWLTIIIDPIAASVILVALFVSPWLQVAPLWHRFGMVLVVAGLYGQTFRNYVALTTGMAPRDSEMPWWVLKDLGLTFLAFHFLFMCLRKCKEGSG
ncbi:ABC transporter substrate-binding protein [Roseibium sediminis]|uniref:ABC transporter substrate-binding protein n=1 Tax=Roseibium sediminis TaxID=1775174 RepID=UPI00123DF4AA|nr:ABC transporter substrate-binding protein [Roseibium sediminis]